MKLAESKNTQGRLSLLIATIAVLLSQFPPVYQWFYAPELEIKVGQSFSIIPNPYYGLSVSKYYSVTNIGEEYGRIKSIYLFIADMEENILYETRAQSYRANMVPQFGEVQWEEFTEVSLRPGENWSHLVAFFSRLKNSQFDDIREIQNEIEEERENWEYEMEKKGYDIDDFDPKMPEFQISNELAGELKAAIIEKIKWLDEGKYKLYEVSFTGNEPKVVGYSFTIHEYHITRFGRSLDTLSSAFDISRFLPHVIFELELDSDIVPKSIKERVKRINERFF